MPHNPIMIANDIRDVAGLREYIRQNLGCRAGDMGKFIGIYKLLAEEAPGELHPRDLAPGVPLAREAKAQPKEAVDFLYWCGRAIAKGRLSHIADTHEITDLDYAVSFALSSERRKRWVNLLLSTSDQHMPELLERWQADTGIQIPRS